MGVSKVIVNGVTKVDLTSDTVAAANLLSGYAAHGADGNAVSGSIASKSSTDLTVSGATVTAPAGYYGSAASKSVASGSATTPTTTITANPTISVNSSTGVISASVSGSESITPTVSAGYISSGTAGTVSVSGSNTSALSTQSGTTINPTESEQTAVEAGKYTLGAVKVGAISSTYVGSGIDRRDDTDLTVSGATVTVPTGYYEDTETKSVASGTEGTPTATKGSVSNNSISVTPSVTNTAGYISGSTKTGTAVTVSASELVSGSKTIVSNVVGEDVTNYATVTVAVPSDYPETQSKTATPTETEQTILPDSGKLLSSVTVGAIDSEYVGSDIPRNDSDDLTASGATVSVPAGYYEENASKAIALGTEGIPTATKGTVSSHSVSVTPSVTNTAGYISGGTITGTAVSVSASDLVSGTLNISSSGTKNVTNYASVSVPQGTVTAPNTISGSDSVITVGTNLLTFKKTVSVTPNVTTAGYISSGTAGNSNVSLSAIVLTKAAETYTPGTSNKTIAAGVYIAGTQTILGDENLIAANIVDGVTIFGVTGTAEQPTAMTAAQILAAVQAGWV